MNMSDYLKVMMTSPKHELARVA